MLSLAAAQHDKTRLILSTDFFVLSATACFTALNKLCLPVAHLCKQRAQFCKSFWKVSAMLCSPPAPDSAMHRQLVAIGRAAAAYGKLQAAQECFAAAGQWVELMSLC